MASRSVENWAVTTNRSSHFRALSEGKRVRPRERTHPLQPLGRTDRVSLPTKVSNSPTTTPSRVPTPGQPSPRTGPAFHAVIAGVRAGVRKARTEDVSLLTRSSTSSTLGRPSPERPDARHRSRRESVESVGDDGAEGKKQRSFDPLDSTTRSVAQLAPPASVMPTQTVQEAPAPLRALASMEELLPRLVRRIAWAGDRTRGSVQLELGAGPHAGTVVTVHADERRVRLELQGTGSDELGSRIEERLARRGFEVER